MSKKHTKKIRREVQLKKAERKLVKILGDFTLGQTIDAILHTKIFDVLKNIEIHCPYQPLYSSEDINSYKCMSTFKTLLEGV